MQSSVTCVNVLQCECSQWRQQCSSPAALLSIKHCECDSRRRKPSCPLAHFCGLASPWNRNLSHKEQKQVWGSDPAAQVYYDMFFITLFLQFASRSWFTERPVRNCGLETNIFFFFSLETQRWPMRMNPSSADLKVSTVWKFEGRMTSGHGPSE